MTSSPTPGPAAVYYWGYAGGFQMLGAGIEDAEGVDGRAGQAPGLGLLDVHTAMTGSKAVRPVEGALREHRAARIRLRNPRWPDHRRRLRAAHVRTSVAGRTGARSANGLIEGSYVHGVFTEDEFRREWLRRAGVEGRSTLDYGATVEAALDAWTDGVEQAVDVDALLACAGEPILATSGLVMTAVFGGALLMLAAWLVEVLFGYPDWLYRRIRAPGGLAGSADRRARPVTQPTSPWPTPSVTSWAWGRRSRQSVLAACLGVATSGAVAGIGRRVSWAQAVIASSLICSRSLYHHVRCRIRPTGGGRPHGRSCSGGTRCRSGDL